MCRKVLGTRVKNDEEFWDLFREAMRKLAARCRRVRHAKKVRSPKMAAAAAAGIGIPAPSQQQFQQQQFFDQHSRQQRLQQVNGMLQQQQQPSLNNTSQQQFNFYDIETAVESSRQIVKKIDPNEPEEVNEQNQKIMRSHCKEEEGIQVETIVAEEEMDLMDVNEVEEFSSSQSPHTPNSSITHNSTPTPTSLIKEEEHDVVV